MTVVVGYCLSHPFTASNLWLVFLVCVSISEHVTTSECSACAFVSTQDFLCLPPAQPYPVYNSWQHARGGQGQTSPVRLNNNSYFKRSPLWVPHCPPAAILRPEPLVSLWQVQWLPGCRSCLNTWGYILSGTWWLYTGAAYLTDSHAGGTAAGERGSEGEGRKARESWKEGMGAGSEKSEEANGMSNWRSMFGGVGVELEKDERKRRAKFGRDSRAEGWSWGKKGGIWVGLNEWWRGRFKKEIGDLRICDEVKWTEWRKDVRKYKMHRDMMGKGRDKGGREGQWRSWAKPILLDKLEEGYTKVMEKCWWVNKMKKYCNMGDLNGKQSEWRQIRNQGEKDTLINLLWVLWVKGGVEEESGGSWISKTEVKAG